VIEKVRKAASGLTAPVIGCLGLAFKADVDDLRGSPAEAVARRIRDEDLGRVIVSEPNLKAHRGFDLMPAADVIREADIVVLLVDHKEFRQYTRADFEGKVLIDTRGVIR
jgi:UDP-N-acetyl-D-mannosaminuronic acid dehydrogenase